MLAVNEPMTANRAETKRLQVLEAAATCFRRYGFHATSIARISMIAGMSPGHIYHYFPNKEAIVAGIVDRNLGEFAQLAKRLEEAQGPKTFVGALMEEIAPGVEQRTDPARTSLDLEMLAEASRNFEIRSALQRSGDVHFERMRELFRQAPSMRQLSPVDLDAHITVITSLFDGLMVRTLCQSNMDNARTSRIIERVVGFLLSEDEAD
jgi:AcrR family transcriptional regulator